MFWWRFSFVGLQSLISTTTLVSHLNQMIDVHQNSNFTKNTLWETSRVLSEIAVMDYSIADGQQHTISTPWKTWSMRSRSAPRVEGPRQKDVHDVRTFGIVTGNNGTSNYLNSFIAFKYYLWKSTNPGLVGRRSINAYPGLVPKVFLELNLDLP